MGWIRPSGAIEVERPIGPVFSYYLMPLAWAPEPAFSGASLPLDRALGVGDHFTATYRSRGAGVEAAFVMVDADRPRLVVVEATIGRVRQSTSIELEAMHGTTTAITMTIDVSGSGPSILNPGVEFFLPIVMKFGMGRVLRGEQNRVEAAIPA